jgi:hypothetical protein
LCWGDRGHWDMCVFFDGDLRVVRYSRWVGLGHGDMCVGLVLRGSVQYFLDEAIRTGDMVGCS